MLDVVVVSHTWPHLFGLFLLYNIMRVLFVSSFEITGCLKNQTFSCSY